MKTDVNVPTNSNEQKNVENNLFFVEILSAIEKIRILIRKSEWYGSVDPNPY
jgi:hypothetical protein